MSGLKMTSKEFHRVTKRDFENGAVRNEISNALKDRENLLAENKKLAEIMRDWQLLSVEEYCHKHHYQQCFECKNASCGDNTNDLITENKRLGEALEKLLQTLKTEGNVTVGHCMAEAEQVLRADLME